MRIMWDACWATVCLHMKQIGVAHVTKEEFFSMCSNMVDNSYLVLSAGARYVWGCVGLICAR